MYSIGVTYALRALVYIATQEEGRYVPTREISAQEGLPGPFLGKLLISLGRAGITTSCRGPGGGHVLARDPDEISLLDVVTCIDGPLEWDPFTTGFPGAGVDALCPLHRHWRSLWMEFITYLREGTVSMLSACGGPANALACGTPCSISGGPLPAELAPTSGCEGAWDLNR